MKHWRNATLPRFRTGHLAHTTLADLDKGSYTMEVWRETLAPHAETDWQRHGCEKIVVVLAGSGACRSRARQCTFERDSTLVVGSGELHQLVNTGDEPLELLQLFGMTPVVTRGLDGAPTTSPWDAGPPLRIAAGSEP